MTDKPTYTFHTKWSDKDQEWIGTCLQFPSLSYCGRTPSEAMFGIEDLVASVLEDLRQESLGN